MAIFGLSAEYELADVADHPAVPPDEWFEMCDVQRAEYLQKFNKMTVEHAIGGKSITDNKVAFAKPVDDLKESLQAVNVCTAELKTCSITVTLLNKCHCWGR